jgi:uncharacterized PurR-regulated membrane protein YhhQ (DUF165 family)
MGNIIPLFGTEVVGGSTYFPAVFLAIAMCAKKFGVEITLHMLNCITRGLLLFSLAQFRWLFFAVYAPEQTSHTIASAELIGRNAILMTGMTYFGGLLILGLRKYLEDSNPHYRFVLPVVVDITIMTPVSIWAAYTSHFIISTGGSVISWEMVIVWTYFCRILVPVIILTYIMHISEWQSDRIETLQETKHVEKS